MTRARMKQAKAAAALLAWGVLPSAWAGVPVVPGAIVYAPLSSAAPVPTLGEWSLTLMALLLAVVAYRVLRGRVNGRLMTPLLLTGGLAAAGLAGHDLVGLAQAVVPQVQFSQAAGGSVGSISSTGGQSPSSSSRSHFFTYSSRKRYISGNFLPVSTCVFMP